MATTNVITALGAADIDTKELTTNLIAATKEPRQKLIDAERKKAEVAISSAALLKNGLAALQTAATEIASAPKLNRVQVTSTNASVVTGSSVSTATAAAGTYSIAVETLAEPKRMSASFSSEYKTSAPITLTLTVPGAKIGADPKINIDSNKTTTEIVTAINNWVKTNAPDSGFSATLLNTGKAPNPYSIVLQGKSGISNSFNVAASLTGSGTPEVSAPELGFTQVNPAANAVFTVNGVEIERASNRITDVIPGLSLELSAISETPVTITAKPDSSTIVSNIRNFVEIFNTITDFVKKATGPKVTGDDVSGSLQNDSAARGIHARLRSAMTSQFSELATKSTSITHWSSLGVSFDRNGVLKFEDESKFIAAYESRPNDVVTALSNNAPSPYIASKLKSGLAGDIAVISYGMIGASDGTVPVMSRSYEGKLARLDKKQAALDAYVERVTAQYETQFSALNSALASFKSTSSQLEKSLNFNNNK
jgi:flagellar hook-associated protein 2